MGRFVNFVYGGIIIAIAVIGLFFERLDFISGVIPSWSFPIIVILMGVMVLITPIDPTPYGVAAPRRFFQIVRRWIFGLYMVLVGIMSWVDEYTFFPYLANTSVYSLFGQIILLAIGAIYILAAFDTTRGMNISSI